MSGLEFVNEELELLRGDSLYRDFRLVEGRQGAEVVVNGRPKLCLCSNNYLGLAGRSEVCEAAARAAVDLGTGAGASRLISGHTPLHEELEQRLASFEGAEAAIVFPTGYMANLGAIGALVGKEDVVFGDRLNHASLIDACRLSDASFRVYPHGDMDVLERALDRSRSFRRRLVVTDGLFSMDGDLAPLPEIAELADRYGAIVMVDEAHGTGVLGRSGRGAAEALGVDERITVKMGTLSKALGSLGGFVAGSQGLIDLLRNKSRTFIYTTGLPPAVCAASCAALQIVEREPWLRESLRENAGLVRAELGLELPAIVTPIIPSIIGDPETAVSVSAALFDEGLLVPAVRPPTVPKGTSRLRLSVMATHDPDQLRRACHAIARALESRANSGR